MDLVLDRLEQVLGTAAGVDRIHRQRCHAVHASPWSWTKRSSAFIEVVDDPRRMEYLEVLMALVCARGAAEAPKSRI